MSNSSTKTILDFSRFEFKFVLGKALREAVESELQYFMELDQHVLAQEHQKYPVRSLYFDDPLYSAFYDKIDGLKDRSKFRLRTYCRDAQENSPIFLEKKGRANNRVFKHRISLGESLLLSKMAPLMKNLEKSGEALSEEFSYESLRKQIKPVAVIDYYRRPYFSKYDHEFRVTFDEDLKGIASSELFPARTARSRQILPGYTVVEIKFDRTVPAWFHRIIQSYELRRTPLSKICEGMKALGITEEL